MYLVWLGGGRNRFSLIIAKSETMFSFINILIVTLILSSSNAAHKLNICSNVKDGIFLADLQDCNSYYVCMNQTAYHQTCKGGLQFTTKTQRCDYSDASKCVKQCSKTALSTFGYDKTCTKYVLCYGGHAIVQECLDGLQYNTETDRCDFASNVDCRENLCNSVNNPDDLVFIPSQSACDKYFLCFNGEPVVQNCANGLYFNQNASGCDFKAKVNCAVVSNKRTVLPYSKMPPTRANIPCPKKGAHFYSHSNPGNYYFCMEGKGVVLSCSPGLVWDKMTESCREEKHIK